jgi:hypothetical protein
MGDRPRGAAGGDVGQRGEVVSVAVRMLHQLQAHRRHADEIGDLLLLDQAQRLARIPFRHQHHRPADDEAVDQHRHLAGDVEQRHVDQGLGRVDRRLALPLLDAEQGREPDRIGIDAGGDGAVGGDGALGEAGRARGEQDRRIVLRRDLRQVRLPARRKQWRERLRQRPLDRQRDGGNRAAAGGEARGAGLVGDDQFGLGEAEAVAHLLGLPPAVDQGGDAARLQHRHIGGDPGRAVAHRDRDPVALGDVPAAGEDAGEPGRLGVSAAKVSRSPPATTASTAPCRIEKASNSKGKVSGQVGDDRPALRIPAELDAPVRSGDLGQHLVILAVERARHSCPRPVPGFAFSSPPSMKARARRGKP